MLPHRVLSREKLETVFATQYLSRLYLTQLLSKRFTETTRIVSVSAAGMIPLRLDFGNLNGERFYNGLFALVHESVANDLFALRYLRQNPAIHFYNYGPFYVKTGLFTDMPRWFKALLATVGPFVATTTEVAAADVVGLLRGDRPGGMYSRHLKPITPSRYRANVAVQERLWQVSSAMIDSALKQ